MDRRTAKLIRKVAKITDKSQRGLKKAYYALSPKDRYELKKEMSLFLEQAQEAEASSVAGDV